MVVRLGSVIWRKFSTTGLRGSPGSGVAPALSNVLRPPNCRVFASPWYLRIRVISGRFMAEAADDLSTPLGQETAARTKRRFRLPFTGLQALAVVLGLFLVVFAGFALFNDNPLGGEPMERIVLRQPAPGAEKSAASPAQPGAPSKNPPPNRPRAFRSEDHHRHRRLQRQAPGLCRWRRWRRQGRNRRLAGADGRRGPAPAGESRATA